MNRPDTANPSDAKQPDVAAVLAQAPGRGNRFWLPTWMILVALAILLLLAWQLWPGRVNGTTPRYLTQPVTRADITVLVTATGSVEPTNQVEISSELSGTIRKVLVDYNAKVTVGQTLAELDTDKLQASVESARAKLAAAEARVHQAEATLRESRLDFQRQLALRKKNIVSQQTLDTARASRQRAQASLESARADVVAAQADLRVQETNLEKTCICSPINGVVLSRTVEPGQTVASALQAPVLFTIAEDLAQMEVQVDVDEADVGKVAEGQPATFKVDAYPERSFSAKIRELRYGSQIVQGVVTYKAILTTDNTELLLRPGMTATAEIVVEEVKDALTVPNAALRFMPPKQEEDKRSLVDTLISGRPRLREASENRQPGSDRTVWVLRDGAPVSVGIRTGATDGVRTVVLQGDINPDLAVIVDTENAGK